MEIKSFLKMFFCLHRWNIRHWSPLDKEGQVLFEDVGLLNTCEKCGKRSILFPKFPVSDDSRKEKRR